MTPKQQRLAAIVLVMSGIIIATVLTLTALRTNVSFFYTPSAVVGPQAKPIRTDRPFRLGGMVVYGSVEHHGTMIRFTVTDYAQDIPVEYTGLTPGLFAEGKGVVATGNLDAHGTFIATQLLAKHDENYVPPDMKKAMANIKRSSP